MLLKFNQGSIENLHLTTLSASIMSLCYIFVTNSTLMLLKFLGRPAVDVELLAIEPYRQPFNLLFCFFERDLALGIVDNLANGYALVEQTD